MSSFKVGRRSIETHRCESYKPSCAHYRKVEDPKVGFDLVPVLEIGSKWSQRCQPTWHEKSKFALGAFKSSAAGAQKSVDEDCTSSKVALVTGHMHQHAKVLMVSESTKVFQNFQNVRPCMIEKYKPCKVASPKSVELSKRMGIDPKWTKKSSQSTTCSKYGLVTHKSWLGPESKSHWCLHLGKVHRLSLRLRDTKLNA